ncbi:hypothetical protein IFM89_008613 [Coptis chinensis]|uniref:Peptidase A1 domain-containing protein n=1 Tax=Coptis chinensis TaxID=261450 RepID=A0A835HLU2_9MAGN|nr:hypothetical protein IFM89_008613 [Coptis chinensis]
MTRSDRIRAAVHRSLARQQYFQTALSNTASPNDIATSAWPEDLEYMMEYYIGKTPLRSYGIIDTGSGLLWQQCFPCDGCPKLSIPLYDPLKSANYSPLTCDEHYCNEVQNHKCNDRNLCQYEIHYLDGSYSMGDIAKETLHFHDNNMTVGNFTWEGVVFGCAHANGYINFEYAASLSGNSTPLVTVGGPADKYYFVNLEGISVDDLRLPIQNDTFGYRRDPQGKVTGGGFLIDSGATYTVLHETAFEILTDELSKRLQKDSIYGGDLEVCYQGGASLLVNGPHITFHFAGVDLKLPTWSTWVTRKNEIYCLAMVSSNAISVLGNYQQQNVQVGYDLQNNVIHFDPTRSCTTLG